MKLDINILKESEKEFKEFEKLRKQLEIDGKFTVDQDPVIEGSYYPVTEKFPYIRKGPFNAIKSAIFNKIYNSYAKKINKELTNLKVVGRENLKGIKGAIVTCNHVAKTDTFAVREALKENNYLVAAEFNNWKNPLGVILRGIGFLPLSTSLNIKLMRKFNDAIKFYLKKGKKILIYPEQAMWREYTKPRPLQSGAFHYAVINNKPVIPMFITIEPKSQLVDEQHRMNFGNYTIHILPPIYPKLEYSAKENEKYMKLENFRLWKECYETTYKKKLTYSTTQDVWEKEFSEYNQFLTHTRKQNNATKNHQQNSTTHQKTK